LKYKLSLALCLTLAAGTTLFAQDVARNNTPDSPPNMGRAPKEINGIGRLDLRVFDENGNPIPNAYAELESRRTDGFSCESFGYTNTNGVLPMPPLHMGNLTLKVKAKGYRNAKLEVDRNSLGEPVTVRLAKK